MRNDTDTKMSKLNPLELFAEKLSPEADRAMTRVVERSTRRQLNAIKQYEDKNRSSSLPGKSRSAGFGELISGGKHIGLATYRPLLKVHSSSLQSSKIGAGRIMASQGKTLRLGNDKVIIQILEGKDGQEAILVVSSHKNASGKTLTRSVLKKEALK